MNTQPDYVRGIGPLKKLAETERTSGRGKIKKTCMKCEATFYAIEEGDAPMGRPREMCASCRVGNLREWRRVYDKERRAAAKKVKNRKRQQRKN